MHVSNEVRNLTAAVKKNYNHVTMFYKPEKLSTQRIMEVMGLIKLHPCHFLYQVYEHVKATNLLDLPR